MATAPRNMAEWMRAIERGQKELYGAIPSILTSTVGQLLGEVGTDGTRHPAAPVELVYSTAIYTETTSSKRWARLMVDFPAVTRANDATDLTAASYELWGQDGSKHVLPTVTSAAAGVAAPGVTLPGLAATPANIAKDASIPSPWVLIRTSPTPSFHVDGFAPGAVWTFKVRALGTTTVAPGDWSIDFVVQMVADAAPPPQPTMPVLTVSGSAITVTWDGLAVTGAMPSDFHHLDVAAGTGSSPVSVVARFYRGGGVWVLSGVPYYQPQFVRFRAVDESGNVGPWSAQATGFTQPLVDTDVILSTIDGAKTQLKNIDASVSVLANTVLTRHLVITEDMTAALAQFLHVKAGMLDANSVNADAIQAGSVKAQALESKLVLATSVIAGNPQGTHAQMDGEGFRVFADHPSDGIPSEVVRMGVAATDDYFAISRSNGTLAATISQDGIGAFGQVNATDALYYKGKELSTLLDNGGSKIIAAALRLTGSAVDASGSGNIPYLRVEVPVRYGRIYKVSTSALATTCSGTNIATVGIKYNVGGIASLADGSMTEGFTSGTNDSITLQELFTPLNPATTSFSFLLWMGTTGGTAGFRATPSRPARLYVEDVGPNMNSIGNGTSLDGVATPPPAVNTYVKQYASWNSMNYDGNGNQYNYNTGSMYQGLSPAGYGNLNSISLHPDMTADLAGATVNYIRVYFNFTHWYYNAGGTAQIGVHGWTAIPGTFGSNGVVVTSGGWPKPGARWVDLPASVFAGFKSGAYRGVTLEGDGSYGTYGIADRPVIEIGYTK